MKTLRRIGEWATRVLVIAMAGIALVLSLRSEHTTMQTTTNAGVSVNLGGTNNGHFLDLIPDGTSMTYDEFKKAAGNDVAKLLSWASPKTITRKGNHLVVDSTAPASITAGGVTITIASRVEFDVDRSSPGLAATNIKGVNVTKGVLGPMPIRKASMTDDGNGNTKIKGSLELSRWLPYIPFEVTLDANGQPVP